MQLELGLPARDLVGHASTSGRSMRCSCSTIGQPVAHEAATQPASLIVEGRCLRRPDSVLDKHQRRTDVLARSQGSIS